MTKRHRALNTNVIVKEVYVGEDKKSAGGIIIEAGDRYDMSRAEGIIENIGSNAFEDFNGDTPKIGDRVVFARYAGKSLGYYEDGDGRRIMRDLDVLCVIEDN